MSLSAPAVQTSRLTLQADTAVDLMSPQPISLSMETSLQQAAALLTERGFTGAPVIDQAGRVAGVITQSDLLLLGDRSEVRPQSPVSDFYTSPEHPSYGTWQLPEGFEVENGHQRTVAEFMTEGVISVAPSAPVSKVVAELLVHKIHRLFVVDGEGTLIGVISLTDIVRHLRR